MIHRPASVDEGASFLPAPVLARAALALPAIWAFIGLLGLAAFTQSSALDGPEILFVW